MILRHLEEYWLTEPDELFVSVEMKFVKANGEYQMKYVNWFNPNYEVDDGDPIVKTPDTYPELIDPEVPYLDDIKNGRIVKVNKND